MGHDANSAESGREDHELPDAHEPESALLLGAPPTGCPITTLCTTAVDDLATTWYGDMRLPSRYRYDQSQLGDWEALQHFSQAAASVGAEVRIDDFVCLRTLTVETGTVVYRYEHLDTRRRLHLDGCGRAYRYVPTGDGYRLEPYGPVRSAIAHVLDLDGFSIGGHLRHGDCSNETEKPRAIDE